MSPVVSVEEPAVQTQMAQLEEEQDILQFASNFRLRNFIPSTEKLQNRRCCHLRGVNFTFCPEKQA